MFPPDQRKTIIMSSIIGVYTCIYPPSSPPPAYCLSHNNNNDFSTKHLNQSNIYSPLSSHFDFGRPHLARHQNRHLVHYLKNL